MSFICAWVWRAAQQVWLSEQARLAAQVGSQRGLVSLAVKLAARVRWAQRWATIACQACTAAFSARLVGPWGREGRYCRDSARLSVHVLA